MFLLKKVITPFIMPPGLFIIFLLAGGILLWRRKLRLFAVINIAIAISLWGLSSAPVAIQLTRGLESGLTVPSPVQGDVIILLGGGIREGVPDLTGRGAPSDDMFPRMVLAARLYHRLQVPIIVSGGSGFAGRAPEAPIVARFLVDLGVPGSRVILESRSRDTRENARYCGEILRSRGFRHPILVTSAYHMRRSIRAFGKEGIAVTPVPAQFATGAKLPTLLVDLLPRPEELLQSTKALREYVGLWYYRFEK